MKKNYISDYHQKQVQYLDSINGYSFTRSTRKINYVNLIFLKQFKDTIEIYLNSKKVDEFFKNDYHYDENGEEYTLQDEAPNTEIKSVLLKGKKNVVTIVLKPSNKRVSFESKQGYDNFLLSFYNENWYITGLKSSVKRTTANSR
jgi:hypothetical protein